MDWNEQAQRLFNSPKPEHFTPYQHCEECAEHDETLRSADVESITLEALGNPGSDPITFCSDEGKLYYMPALIRHTLASMEGDFYLEQLLFHLQGDGRGNSLYQKASKPQRMFIAAFLTDLLERYSDLIEQQFCTDDLLRAYEIWSSE